MAAQPIDVYIAYAQADAALMDDLRNQLSAAERIGLVDTWHDGEIAIGSDRETASRQAMDEAEIILLLLSADFFASEDLYEREMQQALQLGNSGQATVLPVLLRDCTWQLSPLADLQILPRNGQAVTSKHWPSADQAFKAVVDEVIQISNNIRQQQGGDPTVYRPTANPQAKQQKDKASAPKSRSNLFRNALLVLAAFAVISFGVNSFLGPNNNDLDPPGFDDHGVPTTTTPNPNATDGAAEESTAPTLVNQQLIDTRNQKQYPTVQLGQLYWMSKNLDFAVPEQSWCADDRPDNCQSGGRLYNFDAARTACPEGWRLPSRQEWLALSEVELAGLQLNFNGVYDRGGRRQKGRVGYYWSNDRSSGGEAWAIEIRSGNSRDDESRYVHWGMSCRCVSEN